MSEATPPTPGTSAGSGPTTVMFRNIIVGVTTTILGSTAVYFLGFHNKGGGNSKGSYLEVKEATTKAWKSYVTIDNIYYKNLLSISRDKNLQGNMENLKNEMIREGARFRKDAENIIKEKDVDISFITMVERRFDRENESEEVITSFYNKLQSIINTDDSPEQKEQQALNETQLYQNKVNGMLERTVTEIEDLSKTLSERYGQMFSLDEFMSYRDYKKGLFTNSNINTGNNNRANPSDDSNLKIDPAMFAGKWSTLGASINLNADGSFYWDVLSTGDKSSGSWKFENNLLYMYPQANPQSPWVFKLTVSNIDLFTMTLTVQPYNTYTLARIRE